MLRAEQERGFDEHAKKPNSKAMFFQRAV